MRRAVVIDPARHLQRTLGADPRIHYVAVGTSVPRAVPADAAE
jgi:hypothetical protein